MSASPVAGVLETCLYASDLDAAERFYADVIGLAAFARVPHRHVFFRCGHGVFLVFDPDATTQASSSTQGTAVPPHGTRGAGHVAFAVADGGMEAWRTRLTSLGVAIEAEIAWPRGGRSLYVRDPAGNSVELATPSIWGLADAARGDAAHAPRPE